MTVLIVDGVKTVLATRGGGDGLRVATVKKHGVKVKIETSDSMDGLLFASETSDKLLFSHFESDLARQRRDLGLPIFDKMAIQTRKNLGQAPLAPTVLCNSEALSPMLKMEWGGELGEFTNFYVGSFPVQARSAIQPCQGSARQLLEQMIEIYRRKLSGSEKIGVFMSAGWDSRLELAAISHVINSSKQKISLIHLCSDSVDLSITKSLAAAMGCHLIVHNREELIIDFLTRSEFSSLRSRLDELPTWRPSIPAYHVAAHKFRDGGGDIVVGFAPHSLKGRQYETYFSDEPPREGLFRVVSSENKDSENIAEMRLGQHRTWLNLRSICSDWDEFAQRDYLLWVLHNGFSYSHRCWPDINPLITTVNNDPLLVSGFMGLDPKLKRGTTFIRYALNELRPELLKLPLRSSTGEVGVREQTRRRISLVSRDTGHLRLVEALSEGFGRDLRSLMLSNNDSLAVIQIERFMKNFDRQ